MTLTPRLLVVILSLPAAAAAQSFEKARTARQIAATGARRILSRDTW